jgi:hypothetical protein
MNVHVNLSPLDLYPAAAGLVRVPTSIALQQSRFKSSETKTRRLLEDRSR